MTINHFETANLLGMTLTEWLQIKNENPNCVVCSESGEIDIELTLKNIKKSSEIENNVPSTNHKGDNSALYNEICILKNSIDVIAAIINTSFFEAMRKQNMKISNLGSNLQEISHKIENLEFVKPLQNVPDQTKHNSENIEEYAITIEQKPEINFYEENKVAQENVEESILEVESIELNEPDFTPDNPPEPFFIGRIETKKKLFGIFPF